MNIYGKLVWEALDTPRTMSELVQRTNLDTRRVLEGVLTARVDGHIIKLLAQPGGTMAFERGQHDPTDKD